MQLKAIDKQRYRRHLNRILIISVAAFSAAGVGLSALLIHWFGGPTGSNTHLNIIGVGTAALMAALCLAKLKTTPYFHEVAYIWDLKYELNLINRKLEQIRYAARQGDLNAMLCLLFHYEGSRQLWLMDDNTLNLAELEAEQLQFNQGLAQAQIQLQVSAYQRDLLEAF